MCVGIAKLKIKICKQIPMAYHLTHHALYILVEPEAEYFEQEELEPLISDILTEFSEINTVIIYTGTLDYLLEDSLDNLAFLHQELMFKNGGLHLVTLSENLIKQTEGKYRIHDTIDDAIDTVEAEANEADLF
jgi:hypothetical protein